MNFTNAAGHTVIARFRRSSDPLIADASSRFDLRIGGAPVIAQPFSNHNGGHLAFGPDGYLYVGLGDGGSGDDPDHRSQNPRELLGKMLRIDVNVPDTDVAGYRVPPDNPFLGSGPSGTRPEIWSFGLRNPWRYSFDDPARGGTGALVIGDVGQNRWEEIDYEPARRGGRNYGWRNREGLHNNVTNRPPAFQPLVDPIFEYGHATGGSVTGGYVYRGTALGDAFRGRYVFADFVAGRIWSLALSIDPSGDARASDLRDHTAGAWLTRLHQLVRRRRRGRALHGGVFERHGAAGARRCHGAAGPNPSYELSDPELMPSVGCPQGERGGPECSAAYFPDPHGSILGGGVRLTACQLDIQF